LNKDDAKDFQLVCVDDDQSVISQYPESKLVLHLEDHRVLKEMSWILCPHHYTLPSVSFETYTNGKPFDRRFEESSYEKLMELFDLPPGKFVATKDLKSQV
jgi:ribulose-5-phosphate 4-epimerase/fuculose-1-phosphate aldolase